MTKDERLSYLAGRLAGLAGSTRYDIDIKLAGELDSISKELETLAKQDD